MVGIFIQTGRVLCGCNRTKRGRVKHQQIKGIETMNKKIQMAITDTKTGQTSISGMELGEIGFGLKLETIFRVDNIEVHEFKNNSQVSVSGRGLDNNRRTFPCETSYIFFPDEGNEKRKVLKMYRQGDTLKMKGEYYFAYGITFFEYPEIASIVSKLRIDAEKVFQDDKTAERRTKKNDN